MKQKKTGNVQLHLQLNTTPRLKLHFNPQRNSEVLRTESTPSLTIRNFMFYTQTNREQRTTWKSCFLTLTYGCKLWVVSRRMMSVASVSDLHRVLVWASVPSCWYLTACYCSQNSFSYQERWLTPWVEARPRGTGAPWWQCGTRSLAFVQIININWKINRVGADIWRTVVGSPRIRFMASDLLNANDPLIDHESSCSQRLVEEFFLSYELKVRCTML